jgi:hypothetical protein
LGNRCVGANEEVGQRQGLVTASATVLHEILPRQKCRLLFRTTVPWSAASVNALEEHENQVGFPVNMSK